MNNLQALALFSFLSIITPGPNNLMIMASSMNFGVRKSLPHYFGIVVGFPLMLLTMGLGLHTVFERLAWFHEALLIGSTAMMIYLAYRVATFSAPAQVVDSMASAPRKPLGFMAAVLFQWVNPKAWFMATAAVALFPPNASAPWLHAAASALVMLLIALVCVGVWLLLGAKLSAWLNSPSKARAFNTTMAGSLVVFFLYSMAQAF